jgi:hypothetical protein
VDEIIALHASMGAHLCQKGKIERGKEKNEESAKQCLSAHLFGQFLVGVDGHWIGRVAGCKQGKETGKQ